MSRRKVHVLEVAEPAVWGEVEAVLDLEPLVEAELSERRRAVRPGSERAIVPALQGRGLAVLLRDAPEPAAEAPADLRPVVDALSEPGRHLLSTAQRRAFRGTVLGARAWHPVHDREALDELVASGLIAPLDPVNRSPLGAWTLHADLPLPPEPAWDVEEALFEAPEDLEPPEPGLSRLLEDAAALAAAIRHVVPRRTHQGHLDKVSCRRLGSRLQDRALAKTGDLSRAQPRWRRALDLLIGLEAVVEHALERTLAVKESRVREVLSGSAASRIDRAARTMAPPEIQPLLEPLRETIRQAGEQAVDDVVLLDLLAEQQDGTFAPDADAFREQEGPLLDEALRVLSAFGLVRRAPGAFAATDDGRAWAGAPPPPAGHVWISSDLEVLLPPDAVGPLDRYRLERLSRPLARDVVDRLRIEREGLADWLTDHTVDDAIALLGRLSPAVPPSVVDTLRAWALGLTRVVLVRNVEI